MIARTLIGCCTSLIAESFRLFFLVADVVPRCWWGPLFPGSMGSDCCGADSRVGVPHERPVCTVDSVVGILYDGLVHARPDLLQVCVGDTRPCLDVACTPPEYRERLQPSTYVGSVHVPVLAKRIFAVLVRVAHAVAFTYGTWVAPAAMRSPARPSVTVTVVRWAMPVLSAVPFTRRTPGSFTSLQPLTRPHERPLSSP